MAVKSYEEYLAEQRAKNDALYQQQLAERNQALSDINNQYVQGQQAAVDTSTAAQTAIVEQQKAALPEAYRDLYDANAVQQLVGERQVAERMANLGLTDSGLNRTQQTALAVQRGNADADVRRQERQAAQQLEQQLLQIRADAEAQKQQIATSANADLATRQYELQSNLRDYYDNLAQSTATSLYNADVQAETERAKLAAQQAQREWENQYKLQELALKYGGKTDSGGNVVTTGTGDATAISKRVATYLDIDPLTGDLSEANDQAGKYLYSNLVGGYLTPEQAASIGTQAGMDTDILANYLEQYANYLSGVDAQTRVYTTYEDAVAALKAHGKVAGSGVSSTSKSGVPSTVFLYSEDEFNRLRYGNASKSLAGKKLAGYADYSDYLTQTVRANL